MRFVSLPMGAALAAHALAWVAAVFFAFAPTYSGESSTAVNRGAESVTETVRYTQTMLEANGPGVIFLLLVPVLLTGIALLAIRSANDGQMRRAAFIWVPTVALLGLCVLAVMSIGLFYLPAALALLTAAIADRITQDSTDGA